MRGKEERETLPVPTTSLIHHETGLPFELYQISVARKFNSARLQSQRRDRAHVIFWGGSLASRYTAGSSHFVLSFCGGGKENTL